MIKRTSGHLARLSQDEDILGIIKQSRRELNEDRSTRYIHKTVTSLTLQIMRRNLWGNSNWTEKVELGPWL